MKDVQITICYRLFIETQSATVVLNTIHFTVLFLAFFIITYGARKEAKDRENQI